MEEHRKIYKQHKGNIPKGYHIHHIDGDHSNNHIDNLQCVSAQEHYDIHKSQGDFGACWALMVTGHISVSPEERAILVSEQQKSLVVQGKHPWQKREDGSSFSFDRREEISKFSIQRNRRLIESNKHHFLSANRDSNMELKRAKTVKKKYQDPEYAEYMRQSKLGRTWKLSEEKRAIVAAANVTKFTTDTADVCKNTIWINDGIKNKRIKITEKIPEGYTKGRMFTPWNKGKKVND
jgi:HNH endonuclease